MNQLLTIVLGAQPAAGGQSGFMQLIPLLLIVVVFYFFMIRPQMKRQKEAKKFREGLQKGSQVITTGGIYGKITEIGETWVMLEVDKNTVIKIDKTGLINDPSSLNNN
jgi:preprotein translocase subunit YajC